MMDHGACDLGCDVFSLGYDARVHLDSVHSFNYEDVSQGFQLLVEAQACGSLPYWSVEGDGA